MILHSLAEFGIDLDESLCDSHAQSFCLTGNATTVEVSLDVVLTEHVSQTEGLFYLIL